ncbi:hypothetical protein JXE04_01790 [Patescibacteria group bacterium]|nr:hypothetical protein [Patescibacteria group bacterium]
MFKCEWLKKLLGLKKEPCHQTEMETPINSEPVSELASKIESEPLKQSSEEVLEKSMEEEVVSQ